MISGIITTNDAIYYILISICHLILKIIRIVKVLLLVIRDSYYINIAGNTAAPNGSCNARLKAKTRCLVHVGPLM